MLVDNPSFLNIFLYKCFVVVKMRELILKKYIAEFERYSMNYHQFEVKKLIYLHQKPLN
jgi:hypothetical protein